MIDNLPILSIRQPWAWAIIHAGKDIENRTWKTTYRGRFWVHAGQIFSKIENEDFRDTALRVPGLIMMDHEEFMAIDFSRLDRGGIIGSVELVACVENSDSPWFSGPLGFVLRNPKPCDFIPMKGQLGFFKRREMEGVTS